MTGVGTKKVQVKVKNRMTVPDVVIRNVCHGKIVLRRTQNVITAKRLGILQKFAITGTKADLQKLKRVQEEEQGTGLLRLVLMPGVDVLESLQKTIKI